MRQQAKRMLNVNGGLKIKVKLVTGGLKWELIKTLTTGELTDGGVVNQVEGTLRSKALDMGRIQLTKVGEKGEMGREVWEQGGNAREPRGGVLGGAAGEVR